MTPHPSLRTLLGIGGVAVLLLCGCAGGIEPIAGSTTPRQRCERTGGVYFEAPGICDYGR